MLVREASRQARTTRSAISPRLAMRTRLKSVVTAGPAPGRGRPSAFGWRRAGEGGSGHPHVHIVDHLAVDHADARCAGREDMARVASSASVGVNTWCASATWRGWMHILPW